MPCPDSQSQEPDLYGPHGARPTTYTEADYFGVSAGCIQYRIIILNSYTGICERLEATQRLKYLRRPAFESSPGRSYCLL